MDHVSCLLTESESESESESELELELLAFLLEMGWPGFWARMEPKDITNEISMQTRTST